MEPELICDYGCEIGENPLWHPFDNRLYWCDIPTGGLFRFDPRSGKHEQFHQGEPVGGFTIQADGSLLLFMAKGAVKIWRESGMVTVIDHLPDEQETRFNDVIADPAGRVFCGMMPTKDRPGRLYRLDTSGEIKLILDDISLPNGLAFSLDRKHLYFTDSMAYKVYRFDYDETIRRNQQPASFCYVYRKRWVSRRDDDRFRRAYLVCAVGRVRDRALYSRGQGRAAYCHPCPEIQ